MNSFNKIVTKLAVLTDSLECKFPLLETLLQLINKILPTEIITYILKCDELVTQKYHHHLSMKVMISTLFLLDFELTVRPRDYMMLM